MLLTKHRIQQIREEQVKLLFASLPLSVMAIFVVASALAVILWPVMAHEQITVWWAASLFILLGRGILYYHYRRRSQDPAYSLAYWELGFLLGVLLSGAMWGMASVMLFSPETTYQVVIAFVVAGISAGAIATLSFQIIPVTVYLLLALLPLIFRLIQTGDQTQGIMALMTTMFLLLLILSARRIYRNYEQNIALNLVSQERENILEKNIAALQSFHAISTAPELDYEDKIQAFLSLGLKTFGMKTGIVARIENDIYTVKYIAGEESVANPGDVFDVAKTYSSITINQNMPCAFNNIGHSSMADHPCYLATGTEAYIGSVITVDNKFYGILSFTSSTPRETAFTDNELMLVQLFAQWLGAEKSRTESEEKLSEFKTTLDLTQDCVFMFRPGDYRFIYVNQGAMDQVGYSYDQLLTMTPIDIKPDVDEQKFADLIAPLLNEEESFITFETVHEHSSGRPIPVEIFLQYIQPPDEEARFIAIVHDISERKRIDKMKDEFVSTVSHELRTPLTSIRGSLGLLLGGAMGAVPVEQESILKIASNNTERLLHLINDILDLQKIGSGKIDYEFIRLRVSDLLTSAIAENEGFAHECDVSFKLVGEAEELFVEGDYKRLMQVMANLLSNAAKFSPAGAEVVVGYQAIGDKVRIAVTDTGAGVPEEFRDRLFKKFSQLDSSDTRKPGGTGLGLSIAKLIVEQHHGCIGYRPAHNGGACFYFELPQSVAVAA